MLSGTNLLEHLIENKDILYIYEIGLQIYGLFTDSEDRDFLLVISDDYDIPKELKDNEHITIYRISDWFKKVLLNEMIAWECACLPKKYVIKEHVKLLLQTNPLQLRKEFDETYKYTFASAQANILKDKPITGQKGLWTIIKYLKFANQIIENHKIVNFKDVAEDYRQIVNGQISDFDAIMDTFNERLNVPLQLFKKYTDGPLKASKIKKILQNKKSK